MTRSELPSLAVVQLRAQKRSASPVGVRAAAIIDAFLRMAGSSRLLCVRSQMMIVVCLCVVADFDSTRFDTPEPMLVHWDPYAPKQELLPVKPEEQAVLSIIPKAPNAVPAVKNNFTSARRGASASTPSATSSWPPGRSCARNLLRNSVSVCTKVHCDLADRLAFE